MRGRVFLIIENELINWIWKESAKFFICQKEFKENWFTILVDYIYKQIFEYLLIKESGQILQYLNSQNKVHMKKKSFQEYEKWSSEKKLTRGLWDSHGSTRPFCLIKAENVVDWVKLRGLDQSNTGSKTQLRSPPKISRWVFKKGRLLNNLLVNSASSKLGHI